MKTFKDLVFYEHPGSSNMIQARLNFDNGYGISVIKGEFAYGDENCPYEIAVLHNGHLCYDTPITDDVVGYLTEDDVTEYMKKIQNLSEK